MTITRSTKSSSRPNFRSLSTRMSPIGLVSLALFSASTLLVGGCSSESPDDNGEDSGDGGGNATASGGNTAVTSGGSTSVGSAPNSNGGSGIVIPPSGGSDGAGGNEPTCATDTQETDIKPIDMYIMFDRSSSMNTMTTPTLWEQATGALIGFLTADGSSDFGVALRFFPDDEPAAGCRGPGNAGMGMVDNTASCIAASCQTPLVPVGTLLAGPGDAQEAALVNAINAKPVLTESQGTPTYAALEGALDWGRARLIEAPDRNPIVVLVTDGDPNGCNDNIQAISGLASAGFDEGIRTYVIGLEGSSENNIRQIATGGGTEGIFIGTAGTDASTALIEALDAIRGEALACEFPTPTTDTGAIVDTGKVNITVTMGDAAVVKLLKVADEPTCAGGTNWFFKDASQETIALCPATCDLVQSDDNARIDIELGCTTIIK